jgi:hypothetical protein
VPPDGSSQPFFTDASRAVLSAVMTVFAKLKEADKKPWSLRDVITALRSSERIRLLVSIFPEVEEMVLPYLDDTWAFPSVLSTIATKMAPFEVVAARFEQAKAAGRMLSLSDWLKTESILVVGSSPANRASLDPINRVIFRRLFDLMLDQENQRDALTWVFLDEVREAGKIEGLSSLLNQGRSKGVSVVLGFQEIEGMIQEYGEHVSAEIFGQCGYKSFLRTGSPKTAQWVEHYWGVSHILEASYSDSVTHSKDGTSVTSGVNHSQQFRQAVHASSLMQFPPTGPRSGVLAGYHDIPGKGPILRYQDWSEIVSLLKEDDARRLNLPPEKSNECRWKDQGTQSEVVRTWTKQEISRFKRFALRSGQVSERDLGQREFVFTYGKEGDVQTPEKPPEVLKAEPPQEKSSSHNATDKKEEPEKPPPGGRGKTTQSQLPSRRNR